MFKLRFQKKDLTEFDFPDSDYRVYKVTGIDDVDCEIHVDKTTQHYGGQYQSWTVGDREITINVKLLGDIEYSRRHLLDFFSNRGEKLRFFFDANSTGDDYFIDGYISSIDYEVFTKSETVAITMICPYPYFRQSAGPWWSDAELAELQATAPNLFWELGLGEMTGETIERFYYLEGFGVERDCILIAHFNATGSVMLDTTVSVTRFNGNAGDWLIIDGRHGFRRVYLIANHTIGNGFQNMSGDFPRIPAYDNDFNYTYEITPAGAVEVLIADEGFLKTGV